MGQDTEIMSRYTLPKDTTTETITFSVPNDQPGDQTLTVHMSFLRDPTHQLSMVGYGDSSNFADGLKIVDATGKLTKLTLALDSGWPDAWTITVNPDERLNEPKKVLGKDNRTDDLPIPRSGDWHVSVTISVETSDGHTITTRDPKIKVIRPTS